jgi:hypothetical protein
MRFKSENRKDRVKELVPEDIKEKRKTPLHSRCSVHCHMQENLRRTKVSFTTSLPSFQNTGKNYIVFKEFLKKNKVTERKEQ